MTLDSSSNADSILRHIPNGITGVRIVIAALFPFCPESTHLLLILIGLASEFLDGFIARLFGWDSYLGEVLDPIADKLLVLSISLTWIALDKLTWWQWTLFASRDFGILLICLALALRGRLHKVRSIPAKLPSKITTALQYLVFMVVLAGFGQLLTPLAVITAIIGAVATLHYAYLLRRSLI